jgi:oxygen-independent coproporphyrinogen-3 oxidase
MGMLENGQSTNLTSVNQADPIALYIHIPFCATKCPYCDFNTYAGITQMLPSYLDALKTEVGLWADILDHPPLSSVFLGGGTPSMLTADQICQLLTVVSRSFPIQRDTEITAECNPDDMALDRLRGFRSAGINRISMGVQSLEPDLLVLLGRRHNAKQAIRAYANIRKAGFKNVNLDLMYGLPTQTLPQWQETLGEILGLTPEHLSAYCLTLEPETPMARAVLAETVPEPDPDLAATMYEWACSELTEHGYQGYEISNWARPNFESRHNLTYWRNQPYLGVGPGAHSSLAGMRFSSLLSPPRYIQAVNQWVQAGSTGLSLAEITIQHRFPTVAFVETISQSLEIAETLMLGLRLQVGVGLREFKERFGMSLLESHGSIIKEVMSLGLVEMSGPQQESRLHLSPKGRLLGNQVFSRLFEPLIEERARFSSQ